MAQRYPDVSHQFRAVMLWFHSFLVWKYSCVQGKITQIFGCSFLKIRRSFLTMSFYSFKVQLLPVSNHHHPDPLFFCITFFSSRTTVRDLIFKSITKTTDNYLISDKTEFRLNCHDLRLKLTRGTVQYACPVH